MTLEALYEEIQAEGDPQLQLRINDNRSTMLSVKWEQNIAKVSLHRMFLSAPRNVMDELACYIRRGKGSPLPGSVRAYIDHQTRFLDYSHEVDKENLVTAGEVYDLQAIFDKINDFYFCNTMRLHITWYGKRGKRGRSQVNFGLYSDPLKLIKIHRLLDSEEVPEYVVEFVVYHEMLHHICLPEVREEQKSSIHTHEFRMMEKRFIDYERAEGWIQENKQNFFI